MREKFRPTINWLILTIELFENIILNCICKESISVVHTLVLMLNVHDIFQESKFEKKECITDNKDQL